MTLKENKTHPVSKAIPRERERPSGKAIPLPNINTDYAKTRPNILDMVDSAVYGAMFNTNQFTPDRPWYSDSIRAWGQLIGTIKREYDRSPQKAILFPLTQVLLYSMNPHLGEGRIFNPIHAMFLLGSPGLAGNIPTTLDTLILGGHEKRVQREEQLGITPFHQFTGTSTLGSMMSAMSAQKTATQTRHELNRYNEDNVYPQKVAVRIESPVQNLFSDVKPGQDEYELQDNVDIQHIDRLRSYDRGPMIETLLPDEDAKEFNEFFPLSLQIYDFMSGETAFFPTSITTFNETIAPNWQLENFIGRVDAVPGYLSTARSISLGLEFFATDEEDFKAMWRKLNWLSSLAYADFDNRGIRDKTPIIRIKLGDVISNSKGEGMLAIITALSYDYKGSSNWEIDSDVGVGPKNIAVSLGITLFHETGRREKTDDETGNNVILFHTISKKNGMKGFRKLGSWNPPNTSTKGVPENLSSIDISDEVTETDDVDSVSDAPPEQNPSPVME